MRGKWPVSGAVWKGIIITETIICYLACLAVVSYIQGPVRYRVVTEAPIPESFTTFAGVPAETGGVFFFENVVPGEVVGYMTTLRLSGLDRIQISFQVECPAEFAGGILFIDLYNLEAGYDNPEQDYHLTVQEGHSEVAFAMAPGENPPEYAYLRIFTLDPAGYRLEDIRIYCEERMPKVSVGLWIGAGICFLLLLGTVAMWMANQTEKKRRWV